MNEVIITFLTALLFSPYLILLGIVMIIAYSVELVVHIYNIFSNIITRIKKEEIRDVS